MRVRDEHVSVRSNPLKLLKWLFPKRCYFGNLLASPSAVYTGSVERFVGEMHPMVCMVATNAHELLLEVIRELSPLPTELIARLSGRLSYQQVQDTLADLMESGDVQLDSSLHLRVTSRAA